MAKEIDRLRKRRQRQNEREARGGLSPRQLDLCVAVYCLGSYDMVPAVEYAREMLKRHANLGDAACLQHGLRSAIEKRFLELPAAAVAAIHLPDTPHGEVLRATALRYLCARSTVSWVRFQNDDQGVAPSSRALAEIYTQRCAVAGVPDTPQCMEVRIRNAEVSHNAGTWLRHWALRFGKRWGLQFGTLRARVRAEPAEIRQKAGAQE